MCADAVPASAGAWVRSSFAKTVNLLGPLDEIQERDWLPDMECKYPDRNLMDPIPDAVLRQAKRNLIVFHIH